RRARLSVRERTQVLVSIHRVVIRADDLLRAAAVIKVGGGRRTRGRRRGTRLGGRALRRRRGRCGARAGARVRCGRARGRQRGNQQRDSTGELLLLYSNKLLRLRPLLYPTTLRIVSALAEWECDDRPRIRRSWPPRCHVRRSGRV